MDLCFPSLVAGLPDRRVHHTSAVAAGKQVGQGFLPWDALTPEDLDPEICPLVEALNRTTWARTIFSCAAHPEEPDSIQQGRRQAHLDLLINNLPRWHTYVQLVRKAA